MATMTGGHSHTQPLPMPVPNPDSPSPHSLPTTWLSMERRRPGVWDVGPLPSVTYESPVEVPRNHVHGSNLPDLPPAVSPFDQLSTRDHSIPRDIPPHAPCLWHANQVYCINTALSTPTHVNQQIQYNPVRGPTDMHMVPESLPTTSSPTAVNNDGMTSASHSTYYPGLYGTFRNSHTAFNSHRTLWPNSSDRHLLVPTIEQEIRGLRHHFLDDPGAYQPLSLSSLAMYSHSQSAANDPHPCVTNHLPSHQSSIPSTSQQCSLPTSTVALELDTRPRIVSLQDSTTLSRRKQGARAIEYGGLWVDEEDLLKGLTEPNGKLNIHQCRWEEGRTPCHLKIKGDKSAINAHIQKWHGGEPGGDKQEVDCRWSSCTKTMLKESIARHIVSVHLGEMWECRGCGKQIARNDAYVRHTVRSNFEACRSAGALITYSADVRVIDARAALDNGGRVRYADA